MYHIFDNSLVTVLGIIISILIEKNPVQIGANILYFIDCCSYIAHFIKISLCFYFLCKLHESIINVYQHRGFIISILFKE
jgi:hypothetical protein